MSVYEALEIVIKKIENDSRGCGTLDEDLRKARIILYRYVTKKLDEEKGELND